MTARHWSVLLSVLVALLILVAQYLTADRGLAERTQAVVTSVVDGDTVHVRDITGHEITVRVVGIDTPETVHPNKAVECYGPEASALARRLLTGTVVLAYSSKGDQIDRYGRTLAYLEVDGKDYGLTAVEQGTARLYEAETHDRQDHYRRAQAAAQREGVGLWQTCE